jgi:hypothetical protein
MMFNALSEAAMVGFSMIPAILALAIPIVAIVTGHRRSIREMEARHAERLAAIEKGLPVPPDPVKPPRKPSSPLLHGLVWLGVGIAVVFCGLDDALDRLGWIPAAVGAAYLIYYIVESLKPRSDPASSL